MEIGAEKATERIARQLARKEHERDWPRSDLYRNGIASRDRPYFDQALALAVQHGWITQRGSDLTAGAVPPPRLFSHAPAQTPTLLVDFYSATNDGHRCSVGGRGVRGAGGVHGDAPGVLRTRISAPDVLRVRQRHKVDRRGVDRWTSGHLTPLRMARRLSSSAVLSV